MRSRQQPAHTYQLVLIANFQVVEHSRLVQVTELGAVLHTVELGRVDVKQLVLALDLNDLAGVADLARGHILVRALLLGQQVALTRNRSPHIAW